MIGIHKSLGSLKDIAIMLAMPLILIFVQNNHIT